MILKVEHITKFFNTKKILDDISFSVKSGEIALFLGTSGVGKSTLLRILNNLETIDSGKITLDSELLNLSTVNTTHIIGMVFQHFNLFENLTVEQNICLPLEKVLKKTAQEAQSIAQMLLEKYGLIDKKNKYAMQLSGGQKQRLAIARTIAMRPKIMCLDEPTSALDPVLTSYVADNIQQLATEGYVVLVASHDTALIEKLECTIYLMSNGVIVESVQSADFKNNPEKFPLIKNFIAGHA